MKEKIDYGVVPLLRARLVDAIEHRDDAKAAKARAEDNGRAFAYATALHLLKASGHDWPDGIAPRQVGILPWKGIDAARRFVGAEHLDILGASDDPPVIER